jgi:uncharacterized protein involved in exopolysaccharide biosynthesis
MSNVLRESPVVARGAPVRPATPAPPSDEIDLLAYAATCWRYRYILLAVTASAAIVAFAINRSITPTYEVNFRLLASASKVGDTATPAVSVTSFRELLESQSLAAALLDEFKLGGPPHNLTPRRFLEDHVAIRMIPDTMIISVAVRLNDPNLLVKVANRYAEKVVDLAQRLNVGEGEYATQMIRQELDGAVKRLSAAEQALRQFQHRTQIELLRTDVDTMLLRRPEALDLTVQIEGERGRLRQAEAELAKQERVRDVPRSLSSVAPLQPLTNPSSAIPEASPEPRPAAQTPPGRLPLGQPPAGASSERRRPSSSPTAQRDDQSFRQELLDPYINPLYEVLQRDVADARSRLAGLEQQRKELVGRLKLDAPAVETLNRLYEAESGLTALTRNYEVARAAYLNAATRHEDARLQIAVRSARLQILDQALPPDRAVAPHTLRNTAAASLIALTIAIIAVLVFDASRQRAVY